MRVCFLVSSLNGGGAERTVTYLAKYGVDNGYEVDIVALNDVKFYDIDENINYIVLSKKNRNNICSRIVSILRRIINFKKYIKDKKPDIIFSIMISPVFYALNYAKNIPVITSERGNPQIVNDKDLKIRNKYLDKVSGMVYQTKGVQVWYKQNLNKDGVCIPNAVGNALAYTFEKPCDNRKEIIVAVGRLSKQKDYPTLIDAFSIVHDKHPTFKLFIYGDGEEKSNLIEYVKSKGLQDYVCFKGLDKNALKTVYESTCFVLSSKYEGMPNSLMEAMAVGTPCVSTNCDYGPRDLINTDVNGILVPVGDVNEIANGINKIITDVSYAKKIANEATRIKETNSIDIISKQYYEYFERIYNQFNEKY